MAVKMAVKIAAIFNKRPDTQTKKVTTMTEFAARFMAAHPELYAPRAGNPTQLAFDQVADAIAEREQLGEQLEAGYIDSVEYDAKHEQLGVQIEAFRASLSVC